LQPTHYADFVVAGVQIDADRGEARNLSATNFAPQ